LALVALVGLSGLFFLLSFQHILRLCRPNVPVPKAYSSGLFASATPMLISSALFLVMSWSDTLMLSYYLPEESVGVYRIAFKVATLITFAQAALNTVVTPMIAGLHSGGSGMGHLAKRVATLNLYTAGPIFLVIVILGPWLIGLFGVESAVQAYPWLLILALGQLANAFAGPVLNVLNMTGYEKSARNTMLVMATANIALNALCIPIWGPLGAAIATASTMIGWNLWAGILVYKYHGLITMPFLAKKNPV
jgi:O-antigen/teichoic acid export membrane protein